MTKCQVIVKLKSGKTVKSITLDNSVATRREVDKALSGNGEYLAFNINAQTRRFIPVVSIDYVDIIVAAPKRMPKTFNVPIGLNYAIKIYKNGTRVYRCDTCNKFFSNKTKKTVGFWESDGEYKHACPHCGTVLLSYWSC